MSNPDDSCFMAPLHLAGRLIMENGGETYRVEETIIRMGHAFGFREVECFAVPSGVFVSYRKADGSVETAVKRIRRRGTNLTRIDAVNAVSRRLEEEHLSCQEVMRLLQQIQHTSPLASPPILCFAAALSSGGWAMMFGGGVWDFVVAFLVGYAVQVEGLLLDRFHMQTLVTTLTGAFWSALLPMLLGHWTGALVVDATVAGALMPLLPGVAMTIAVQDTMRGDMVSGISSAVSAAMTAVLVAGGAMAGTAMFSLLTGGM